MMTAEHELDYQVTFSCGCMVTLYYLASFKEAELRAGPLVPGHVPSVAHVRALLVRARERMVEANEEQARSN